MADPPLYAALLLIQLNFAIGAVVAALAAAQNGTADVRTDPRPPTLRRHSSTDGAVYAVKNKPDFRDPRAPLRPRAAAR